MRTATTAACATGTASGCNGTSGAARAAGWRPAAAATSTWRSRPEGHASTTSATGTTGACETDRTATATTASRRNARRPAARTG